MAGAENKATRPKYIVCLVDNTQPHGSDKVRDKQHTYWERQLTVPWVPVLDQTDRNTLHHPSQQLSSCQAGRKPGHTARSAENKRNDASSVSTVLPVTESDSTDFQWTTSQYSRTQTTLNLEQQPLVTEAGSYVVLISAIALPRSALLFYKRATI